jgi:hypothetical protein
MINEELIEEILMESYKLGLNDELLAEVSKTKDKSKITYDLYYTILEKLKNKNQIIN